MTVVGFPGKREAADGSDDIPVKPQVDDFCWKHFGWGGETLAQRYEYDKDRVVQDAEVFTVYQLGDTDYRYRVRETSGIPGIILDAIWKEEEKYEEGEL
jgi:hypothetical protein